MSDIPPTTLSPSTTSAIPAKKSLAQHFLVNTRVLGRIIKAADISPNDEIVEIGPGRGALTRRLAKRGARVVAVEIDRRLTVQLENEFAEQPDVNVICADARSVDLRSLVPSDVPYKVVANLPYFAAAPIIRRFLAADHKPTKMVVMLQREAAQSIVASTGKMGLLSVAVQLYGRPSIVSSVAASSFRPVPKVTSAILHIEVYPQPVVAFDTEEAFFEVVKAGFSSRRKQLHNCLKHGLAISDEIARRALSEAGIDPGRRAETLSVVEWGALYDALRAVSE